MTINKHDELEARFEGLSRELCTANEMAISTSLGIELRAGTNSAWYSAFIHDRNDDVNHNNSTCEGWTAGSTSSTNTSSKNTAYVWLNDRVSTYSTQKLCDSERPIVCCD